MCASKKVMQLLGLRTEDFLNHFRPLFFPKRLKAHFLYDETLNDIVLSVPPNHFSYYIQSQT